MRLLLLLSLLVQVSQTADCSWNVKFSSKIDVTMFFRPATSGHLTAKHSMYTWFPIPMTIWDGSRRLISTIGAVVVPPYILNRFLAKPELVPVGVQYIYNTVIDELQKSPERKFSFAETGFLWRWYSSQGDAEKHKLQKLVKSGIAGLDCELSF